MRPPVTSTTLQQNEVSRQQQQQYQTKTSEKLLQPQTQHHPQPQQQQQQQHHQHQQQQQFQIARKAKSPTHEILVENHLNSACSTQSFLIATQPQTISLARKATVTLPAPLQPQSSSIPLTASSLSTQQPAAAHHRASSEKKLFESFDQPQRDIVDDFEVEFEAQLVDLSTSPPSAALAAAQPPSRSHFTQQATPQSRSLEHFYADQQTTSRQRLPLTDRDDTNTKRSSILSDCQYSTQSSASSDDVSFGFNSNLEGFFHQQKQQQHQQQQHQHHTRANSFDDAAKHFIINFPGDSFLEQGHQNDCIINLPLSETAPLLNNIEATVHDKQRSICLNKNSASLIFTRKELPTPQLTPPQPPPPPASATTLRQPQPLTRIASANERRFLTPITNNNQQISQPPLTSQHSTKLNLNTKRRCHSLYANHSTALTATSTSTSGNTSTSTNSRRPTKHLPATYHQQQRRSLQLNYNNNLVTTSTCSASNNNCCPSSTKINNTKSTSNGVNAALHRHHQQHQQNTLPHLKDTPHAHLPIGGVNESRTTAAATRKQHAYSWYAPVYSALEEELEQDSRDSSPIRNNLANTKKHLTTTHYPHRTSQKHASSATSSDNETVALLETRNQINIQAQLHAQSQQQQQTKSGSGGVSSGGSLGVGAGAVGFAIGIGIGNEGLPAAQRKGNASAQALTLQLNNISASGGVAGAALATQQQSLQQQQQQLQQYNYESEGPHAGSLGLAGGPLPRRKRLENLEKFFKSLVGLRPSPNTNASNNANNNNNNVGNGTIVANIRGSSYNVVESSPNPMPLPSSPEIRITRTPSDQHVDMSESERQLLRRSQDKLAAPLAGAQQGSTSSLNVVQQKIWNMIRRDGSAASLYQDKSQSLVQYSGLRKCETVLALTTRQGQTPGCLSPHQAPYMGSGVFSSSGVEQIRPLNRLRNSTASINGAATCSRCSSLLSLAASGSRYSLNANGFVPSSVSQQLLTPIPATPPTFHLGTQSTQASSQQPQQRRYTASGMVRRFSFGSRRSRSCSTSSREDAPLETNAATTTIVPQRKISTSSCNSSIGFVAATASAAVAALPKRKISTCSCSSSSGVSCSRKSSAGAQSTTTTNSSISPPSNQTTATLNSILTPTSVSTAALATAATTTASLNSTPNSPTFTPPTVNSSSNSSSNTTNNNNSSSSTPIKIMQPPSAAELLCVHPTTTPNATSPPTSLSPEIPKDFTDGVVAGTTTTTTSPPPDNNNSTARPFEMFTCKLCLIDVECVKEATTLIQCGCQFCTECMKAYIEFEISEGAYEISCPDAQCPAQGVITLPEIANLTTANLMKKHHRYRLNREIELDKTRTWCPRAGCETVCRVGNDLSAPSTSTAASNTPTSPLSGNGNETNAGTAAAAAAAQQLRCSVLCPSCKDEFCSACKKTWHPNMTCEENSRRLVADGQDDIGIPFDNDLIKCCPMCAVPIEKDEGCAQMMCKRCKHVFCWYCLASLDDDFLLRHYDKGPCKNKLGHSRASVVWHRAQVIGIFAGFGILLLVASPLLLLAAPCIICCKCRSCSSKIDEGDAELEEATQLQSF